MDDCSGTMSEQLDSSAADTAQQKEGTSPAAYEDHEGAPSTSYVHRHGTLATAAPLINMLASLSGTAALH